MSVDFGEKSQELVTNLGRKYVSRGQYIYKRIGTYYVKLSFEELCLEIRRYSHGHKEFLPNTRSTTIRDVADHFMARVFEENLEQNVFIGEKKSDDVAYIPVRNGILKLEFDGKEVRTSLLTHSENFFSLYCLPYEYKPDAQCPKFLHFINEIMTPDQVLLFQQWLGYCLIPTTRLDKMMMVLGAGGNGKGVLFLVARMLLGEENVSSFPLEDLFKDSFAMAELDGKPLNISEEMENGTYIPIGKLKAFTGGSSIYVNQKYIKRHLMEPITRLMNSGNGYPNLDDSSTGILRRLLIIELKRQFLGKDGNSNLKKKSYWQDELAGIFVWALEGLRSLVANGENGWEFLISDEIYEKIQSYDRGSSPLKSFFQDYIIEVADEFEWSSDVYECYKKFCYDFRFKTLNHTNFTRSLLRHYYPRVTESKNALRRKGRPRDRVFYGIRLKTDEFADFASLEINESAMTQMTLAISKEDDNSDSKG